MTILNLQLSRPTAVNGREKYSLSFWGWTDIVVINLQKYVTPKFLAWILRRQGLTNTFPIPSSNFWTDSITSHSETEVLKLLYSFRFQKVNSNLERLARHVDLTSTPPTLQFYFKQAWAERLVALGMHLVLFLSTLSTLISS